MLKRRYNGRITYNLKSPANITEYEIMAKSIYGACDGASIKLVNMPYTHVDSICEQILERGECLSD